MTQGNSTAERP